ncbi:MAG: RNA polymerase-binding protein RbpA [Candidatus Nanopelagicales bacterium]|nr:RNA polymerase-binding protein RbpA [Candidatus Nanopelagicales bacterium]
MSDGALRGTRLGATSYESDVHVEFAPRQMVTYDCPDGHETTMPFSVEAEVPALWECRCGVEALMRDGERPVAKPVKPPRTHWDMLLERRSRDDLEVLLAERLTLIRNAPAKPAAAPARRVRKSA